MASLSGLHLMAASSVFTGLMAALAKLATGAGIPVFEVVAARSSVLLCVAAGLAARSGVSPLASARPGLLALRGALGFAAISSMYSAVSLLPLADAAALSFLSPVVVALSAPCVLREPPSQGAALALPLALAGVLLVAQPPALFGGGAAALSALGVAAGLLQAGFSAGARMSVRALGTTGEPVSSIIFAVATVSTVGGVALGVLLPSQRFIAPPSALAWAYLAGTGLCACGVQLLQTTALQRARAAPAVAMSYVGVLWGLLYDLLLFHRVPGTVELVGAALVCAASLALLRFEQGPTGRQHRGATRQGSQPVRMQGGEGDEEQAAQPLLTELKPLGAAMPAAQ